MRIYMWLAKTNKQICTYKKAKTRVWLGHALLYCHALKCLHSYTFGNLGRTWLGSSILKVLVPISFPLGLSITWWELGIAIGRGEAKWWGLRPRLIWFCLTPSPSCITGKTFLLHPRPLGPHEAPPHLTL